MPRRELSGAPPSRWKVVERDRRLEVVDTQTGERLASRRPPEPAPPPGAAGKLPLVRQTRFDGGGELTTHRFYDNKAPRLIQLDAGSAATVGRVQLGLLVLAVLAAAAVALKPWLLAVLVPLLSDGTRRPLRRRITAWLDQVERETR